jgi:hypothetical protein
MKHFVLTFAFALFACGSRQGTSLRLSVAYDDAWALSGLEVRVNGRIEHLGATHEVLLLLPDEDASLALIVTATRGDDRSIAPRTGPAWPVRHEPNGRVPFRTEAGEVCLTRS